MFVPVISSTTIEISSAFDVPACADGADVTAARSGGARFGFRIEVVRSVEGQSRWGFKASVMDGRPAGVHTAEELARLGPTRMPPRPPTSCRMSSSARWRKAEPLTLITIALEHAARAATMSAI